MIDSITLYTDTPQLKLATPFLSVQSHSVHTDSVIYGNDNQIVQSNSLLKITVFALQHLQCVTFLTHC